MPLLVICTSDTRLQCCQLSHVTLWKHIDSPKLPASHSSSCPLQQQLPVSHTPQLLSIPGHLQIGSTLAYNLQQTILLLLPASARNSSLASADVSSGRQNTVQPCRTLHLPANQASLVLRCSSIMAPASTGCSYAIEHPAVRNHGLRNVFTCGFAPTFQQLLKKVRPADPNLPVTPKPNDNLYVSRQVVCASR